MRRVLLQAAIMGLLCYLAPTSYAQTIAPAFAGSYSLSSLGSVPGVPAPYGGLTFLAGDSNTLLIGGAANGSAGAIYSIGVVRDVDNHITGFSGTATLYATAPQIDGGLSYGPGGILFATGFPNNTLLQYKPGSTTPDKIITLDDVSPSVGSLAFVPTGFVGAGGFRILSYSSGNHYTADLVPDGSGTYDIANIVQRTTTAGGPEGMIYVPPGSSVFSAPSVLISEYTAGAVRAYELDANGDPIPGTSADFITGLSGAEGAFIDPVTNDFLFSTFGSNDQVVRVSGFAAVPEPGVLFLGGTGVVGFFAYSWNHTRRRKTRIAKK